MTLLETEVFRALNLTGVILLTEESQVIASRLAMRDKAEQNVVAISQLLKAESAHAHAVCLELGRPLAVIHAPTEVSVADAVKKLIEFASMSNTKS